MDSHTETLCALGDLVNQQKRYFLHIISLVLTLRLSPAPQNPFLTLRN